MKSSIKAPHAFQSHAFMILPAFLSKMNFYWHIYIFVVGGDLCTWRKLTGWFLYTVQYQEFHKRNCKPHDLKNLYAIWMKKFKSCTTSPVWSYMWHEMLGMDRHWVREKDVKSMRSVSVKSSVKSPVPSASSYLRACGAVVCLLVLIMQHLWSQWPLQPVWVSRRASLSCSSRET